MRKLSVLAALALALSAAPASAQSGFMPYLGYNFGSNDADDGQLMLGVGFRAAAPLPSPVALIFQPSVEVTLDDATVLQFDANLIGEFSASPAIAPYAGGGLAVTYLAEDVPDSVDKTDIGVNVLGGLIFNAVGFVRPFAQARYTFSGDNYFTLQGGIVLGF